MSVFPTVISGDKPTAPMVFSRNASLGFKLPFRWDWGSCVIAADMYNIADPNAVETFPMTWIPAMAVQIIKSCMSDKPPQLRLGGRTRLGPTDGVRIFVVGKIKPAKEWPFTYNPNILPSSLNGMTGNADNPVEPF